MKQTEYWEPESLVAALVVGAKVRVRGFAECPFYNQVWGRSENTIQGHTACHMPDMIGQVGRLIATDFHAKHGHRFEVEWGVGAYGHYAAIELEPVEG